MSDPGEIHGTDYFEFGPFRLEPATRSLYRGDEFIALTPKALDTLWVLVQEAGRVVSKEEILQRVWPDAYVEEGSVANNVSMLRKILHPHFPGDGPIATVSRRGYRFTAPVHLRNADAQIGVVADSTSGDWQASRLAEAPLGVPEGAKADRTRVIAIAASVLLVVAAIPIATAMRVNTVAPAEARALRRAVAVLSMNNLSGNTEYAWVSTALSETINTELIAGGQLRLISGTAVRQMLQDRAPEPGMAMSRKQLDVIGRSLGCDLILTGAYLHKGGRVRLDLRLDDIVTGRTVATVGVEESEDELLDLVEVASRELRTRLGLTPPPPGKTDTARAALSSNPNALRYYFLGLEALRNHEINRSTELLTQAIGEDADFALAQSVISISWRVLGYDDKSQAAAKKAFALAPGLAREDQLAVEGAYYEVMGEVPKAIEKYQALWNFFPDNIAYGIKLVHQQLRGGELDGARLTLDQIRALPPPADGDPRVDVIESDWFVRKGAFTDARRVAAGGVEKAARRKSPQLQATLKMTEGRAAAELGELNTARRVFAEAQALYEGLGDSGGAGEAMRGDAMVLQARGELSAAMQRLDAAHAIGLKMNHQRLLTDVWLSRSGVALQLGNLKVAKADGTAALSAARALGHRSAIARALNALGSVAAVQGDTKTARAHFEEAERLGREIGEPSIVTSAAKGLAALSS